MKLYYDKRLKDPTYYAQQGIRNGKKTTTRNVKNFGKHSELLKITDDPEAYVREEIKKMNEEYRIGRAGVRHFLLPKNFLKPYFRLIILSNFPYFYVVCAVCI